jgi:dienelactone hydrolase
MKMLLPLLAILISLLYMLPAQAKIQTQTITYNQGSTVLEGYLAYDDNVRDRRPGVVIAHEWMGISDYEKRRARELAELGYVALAADIYGKGVRPADPQEAARVAGIYRADRVLLRARMQAAVELLRNNEFTDTSHIAAIGYCFGGMAVLELARSGADISGVVSFHGTLDTPNPADAKNIKCKVLVLHGGNDPHVPLAQLTAFMTEMRNAKVDWQICIYGGAVHSFTNPASGDDPSRGAAYNARADRRSWQAMRNFFNELFPARS